MREANLGIWLITDKKEIRCPNCRSLFYIKGTISPGVSNLQDVFCPVCGQRIWVNTYKLFGVGRKWVADGVIEKGPEPIPHPIPVEPPPANTIAPSPSPEPKPVEMPDWLKTVLIAGGIVLGGLVLMKLLGD